MTDRTSVLAALENGGNEFGALRDSTLSTASCKALRAECFCLHKRRLEHMVGR